MSTNQTAMRKLTRKERLAVYRQLTATAAGEDCTVNSPVPLSEDMVQRIWREFHPGQAKPAPATVLRGIRGDKWYCEAGCGAVVQTKVPGNVFIRPAGPRKLYCNECFAEWKAKQEPAKAGPSGRALTHQ